MKEAIDYKAVIEDLEQKRVSINARFDAAITAIHQVMALEDVEPQPALPGMRSLPMPQSAAKPYVSMGMVEAAKHHLAATKHPVPNLQLAAALVEGGFPHRSKNFPNTLNSVLWRRTKTKGDIAKTGQSWGLTEWKRRLAE